MAYVQGGPIIEQKIVRRERWSGDYQGRVTPLVMPGQEVLSDQPVLRRENDQVEPAGLYGRVVDITHRGGVIIESQVVLLRGRLGVGAQAAGRLTFWSLEDDLPVQHIPPGAILVVPGNVHFGFLRQAAVSGVTGIIASSISLGDLEGFLNSDVLRLLKLDAEGQARLAMPPLTLMLTEGIGTLPMPGYVIELLSRHKGQIALLSGSTVPHQGVVPELMISLLAEPVLARVPARSKEPLRIGDVVHVIGGEHKSMVGVVEYLFSHQQRFPSGICSQALFMRAEDGTVWTLPLVMVERVE